MPRPPPPPQVIMTRLPIGIILVPHWSLLRTGTIINHHNNHNHNNKMRKRSWNHTPPHPHYQPFSKSNHPKPTPHHPPPLPMTSPKPSLPPPLTSPGPHWISNPFPHPHHNHHSQQGKPSHCYTMTFIKNMGPMSKMFPRHYKSDQCAGLMWLLVQVRLLVPPPPPHHNHNHHHHHHHHHQSPLPHSRPFSTRTTLAKPSFTTLSNPPRSPRAAWRSFNAPRWIHSNSATLSHYSHPFPTKPSRTWHHSPTGLAPKPPFSAHHHHHPPIHPNPHPNSPHNRMGRAR